MADSNKRRSYAKHVLLLTVVFTLSSLVAWFHPLFLGCMVAWLTVQFIWIVLPCWLKCSEGVALPFASSDVAEDVKQLWLVASGLTAVEEGQIHKTARSFHCLFADSSEEHKEIPFDMLKLMSASNFEVAGLCSK